MITIHCKFEGTVKGDQTSDRYTVSPPRDKSERQPTRVEDGVRKRGVKDLSY